MFKFRNHLPMMRFANIQIKLVLQFDVKFQIICKKVDFTYYICGLGLDTRSEKVVLRIF